MAGLLTETWAHMCISRLSRCLPQAGSAVVIVSAEGHRSSGRGLRAGNETARWQESGFDGKEVDQPNYRERSNSLRS
jgi:hypothetical protein